MMTTNQHMNTRPFEQNSKNKRERNTHTNTCEEHKNNTKRQKRKKSKSDPTVDGGKISHIEKLTFCTSVASGMAFLHSRNIAHRDLKLSNVLLGAKDDPSTAKIADFGLSKTGAAIQDVMERTANVGTPVYMAVSAIKLK